MQGAGQAWERNTGDWGFTQVHKPFPLSCFKPLAIVSQLMVSHWATPVFMLHSQDTSLNGPLLVSAKGRLSFLVSECEALGKSGLCVGAHLLPFLINTLHSVFIPWRTIQASGPSL